MARNVRGKKRVNFFIDFICTWFSFCSQKYRIMIKDLLLNFWFIARIMAKCS
jgi:hypothetical protein